MKKQKIVQLKKRLEKRSTLAWILSSLAISSTTLFYHTSTPTLPTSPRIHPADTPTLLSTPLLILPHSHPAIHHEMLTSSSSPPARTLPLSATQLNVNLLLLPSPLLNSAQLFSCELRHAWPFPILHKCIEPCDDNENDRAYRFNLDLLDFVASHQIAHGYESPHVAPVAVQCCGAVHVHNSAHAGPSGPW